jgi:hypothetical protein
MKSHGIVFDDVVKPSDYHYTYLNRYCPELYDTVNASYPGIQDIQDYILNRNVNDHQHWHLDKTITFTPFKDIDLLALVVNSSKDLIIAQARDGFINRELIKRMDPHKLSVLSRQKNKNPLENL